MDEIIILKKVCIICFVFDLFFNMFVLQIRAAETELDVDSGIVQLLDDFIITGINGNRKSFQSYLKQYLKLIYLFFPKSRCLHGIRGVRLESS